MSNINESVSASMPFPGGGRGDGGAVIKSTLSHCLAVFRAKWFRIKVHYVKNDFMVPGPDSTLGYSSVTS